MTPRAARPTLAMACAGRLSDARRALVDMRVRVGDDDIDGIPGPAFRFFKDLGDPCHHLPGPGRFMHGAAIIAQLSWPPLPSPAVADDGVAELAGAAAARGVIRPGALHREG